MIRILKYVILDILKSKIVIAYAIVLALFSWSAFGLENNVTKGLLTLLNIILLIVPLVSILFATIYTYNSNEFIELLASHPVKRGRIWKALFGGLSLSLVTAFMVGAGIPILIFASWKVALTMIAAGIFISVIFVSLALLSSILSRDKAKGIGLSIMLWLYFTLLFDAIVLFLLFQFGDYPIEKFVVVLSALSPVDLCRILILLQLDVSAMMGYTGAIFKTFFGTATGLSISFLLLTAWSIIPFLISLKKFKKRDL